MIVDINELFYNLSPPASRLRHRMPQEMTQLKLGLDPIHETPVDFVAKFEVSRCMIAINTIHCCENYLFFGRIPKPKLHSGKISAI